MLFGTGLAFYLGKPLIQPQAPQLPAIPLGNWSGNPVIRSALQVNSLVPIGIALAVLLWWGFAHTRAGLLVRMAGDSAERRVSLGTRSRACASRPRPPGASSPASAGHRSRCSIPEAGTKHLQRARPDRRGIVIFERWSPLRCIWRCAALRRRRRHRPSIHRSASAGATSLFNTVPVLAHAGRPRPDLQTQPAHHRGAPAVVFHALNRRPMSASPHVNPDASSPPNPYS